MARERILVVDDEASVAVTMQATLELDGHDVTSAASGLQALDLVRAGPPFDLVLTDLRLPDVDGLQVIGEVRRRSADSVTIVLTGYASVDSAVRALREGAYAYLLKPCDAEELRATVARGLERRRLGEQLRARAAELEAANARISALNVDLQRRVDAATAELRGRIEQLKELDGMKSHFMSIASHELKTPVTAMSGFLQIALRRIRLALASAEPPEDWRPRQEELLRQIEVAHRQTGRLAKLIDELLEVSRLQTGRLEFHMAEVDLAALVRDIADGMQPITRAHALRVEAGATPTIVGDRDHLEQVFTNLIENAIRYSPDGGSVEIAVRDLGGEMEVSVRDEGIGVPAGEEDAIFGLFYRSPDRRARDAGGMGLGLYISKEIVERHGGRIWAEGGAPKGTTFRVRLPRRPAELPADPASEPQAARPPEPELPGR